MSWFSSKKATTGREKTLHKHTAHGVSANGGAHGQALGAARTTEPLGAEGAGLTLQQSQPTQNVITKLADFPRREDVLSGVNVATPGLQIPVALQDYVMVLKVDASRTVLVYDPAYTAQVKTYFASLRAAVLERGLRMDSQALYATATVLRDVRLASESQKSKAGTSGSGATSAGSNLFRQWVKTANEAGATDVHMAIVAGKRGEVLMRVDGELEPIELENQGIFTDHDVRNAMKAAFENMADLHSNNDGTFSDAKSMSCMIDGKLGIPNIRLRFTSQRGFFGPKAVSRILHSDLDAPAMPFADMGFSPDQIELLHEAQRLESGAIIQCGITGSGKTTAAKTFVETHPKNGRAAMYGVADPIEYLVKNMHQTYVQRDLMVLEEAGKKDPYSEAIESFLRMDIDLVDVSEIRDLISARALANVSKSGHLAMGTLHTDTIGGILNRLSDPKMGLSRQELTGSKMLRFLSYQALLAKLCDCAFDQAAAKHWHLVNDQAYEANYIDILMTTLQSKYGLEQGVFRFKNPGGCSKCRQRGTRGLTMVAEMMTPDDGWLDDSATGNDRLAMRNWRMNYSDKRIDSPNMTGKLVAEHTIFKALLGQVDPRNITRFGPLKQLEVLK